MPNLKSSLHPNHIYLRLKRYVWPHSLIVVCAGLLFSFIADYPGLMTNDSFDMWNMGVDWEFTDWDAPLISVLMFASSVFRADPSIYLFFQLLIFWSGTYIYSLALREQNGRWPILVAYIGFLPPVIGLSGYLEKTPLQASCFLFVSSVLYFLYVKKKQLNIFLFIILVLLSFIGTVIRDYTYLSALPILFFLFYILLETKLTIKRKWIVIMGCSLSLLIIFYITHHYIVYNFLKAEKKHKLYFIVQYELASIYAHTGIRYADNMLIIDSHEKARELYKQNHGLWRIFRFYRNPNNSKEFNEMVSELIKAVSQNPFVYFKHRLIAISGALGISPPTRTFGFTSDYKHVTTNKYGILKSNNVFFKILRNYQLFCRKYIRFILMPWFYAVINISLVAYCVIAYLKGHVFENKWPHFAILLSGIFFLLVYIFICNANLNRYSYWLIVSTCYGGFGLYSIKNLEHHERDNK